MQHKTLPHLRRALHQGFAVYRRVLPDGLGASLQGTFRKAKDPIFVLGNQKSGTTAIAALLAELAGLSSTLDIRTWTVAEQDQLHDGSLKFAGFLRRHRLEFSRELIKEPALTFLYDDLRSHFPSSRVVFTMRDPRDNVRSILNRVQRAGDKDVLEDLAALPEAWQRIIDNRWLGLQHEHYVDSLAARWNRATDVYVEHARDMVLIRYEDFVVNKLDTIERLASQLGLAKACDISDKLDIQYQPRGNREITWEEFFGLANLGRIERICGSRMRKFGYAPETELGDV
jgi:hypothetical protein